MAEYIDREALRAKAVYMHGFGENKYVPLKAIENAPAADVEVVKHGRWLNKEVDEILCHVYGNCSVCRERKRIDNYCPNCGAKMDLEG